MPVAAAEYTVSRTYLDWLVALPWAKRTDEVIDLPQHQGGARRGPLGPREGEGPHPRVPRGPQAEPDDEGADPLLRRALRASARRRWRKSIATSLGRKFVRVSLGGMRDEAEIRGHRRTYIGALPGQIIQGLRRAESKNPVFILDEIDKLGLRLPRRPVVGAARGARSGAEQHVPRPLPRRAVRSVRGAVHHHGERARSGSAGAARPHGSARARRATPRKRSSRSRASTWSTSR